MTDLHDKLFLHLIDTFIYRIQSVSSCFPTGYDHIAPAKDLGRVVTMIYAIIGIQYTVYGTAMPDCHDNQCFYI